MRLSASCIPLACAGLLALGAALPAHADPAMVADGVLVGPNGMTLYVFDRDAGGRSACNGPCATNWPPLMAGMNDVPVGDWTIVAREDSSRQWSYRGHPVYYWSKDGKPGDRTGDGFNNMWHVVRP